jgi:hypothetical protein
MPAATLIVVTDGMLTLAADEAGILTGQSFPCQVTTAAITATPNLQDVPATFCAPATQVPAATGWQLDVKWLQDWTAPGGGLSGYTFTNDTLLQYFELKLDKDATDVVASGWVRLVAGAFGGDAGVPLPAEAVWPIQGKPEITMPAASPPLADTAEAEPAGDVAEPADVPAGEVAEPVPAGRRRR